MNRHIKILSALSLASSDAREDTLKSIILKTLEFSDSSLSKEMLLTDIKKHFGFEPQTVEIDSILAKTIEDKEILLISNHLELSPKTIERLKENETILSDNEKKRFRNFQDFIKIELEEELELSEIKVLWKHFLDYLYNCFYEYGQDALKTLHPHIKINETNGIKDLANSAIIDFKNRRKDLANVFEKVINNFPSYASQEDIDFLIQLSQKTSSFTSLGINPELLDNDFDVSLIDWTLYLDTNILYSLLDLHSHPENHATKSLIKLIIENQELITINLRYSNFTYNELRKKNNDFSALDDKMPPNAIKAILKSDKIDEFAKEFYSKLLKDSNTAHPSTIIRFAPHQLDSLGIKIGRNKNRIESIGNDYINSQMSDYFRFIEERNVVKEEFYKKKGMTFNPVFKSESQVRHDIILREILRDSRNLKPGSPLTMNNVKFFGLTLDSMLISYDRSKVKEYHDTESYPIFFKPSFLLDKLTRILPVKTNDYKVAFLKAITTKGFYRNTNKSEDILKLVNYLKSKGIDNTDVIYNLTRSAL